MRTVNLFTQVLHEVWNNLCKYMYPPEDRLHASSKISITVKSNIPLYLTPIYTLKAGYVQVCSINLVISAMFIWKYSYTRFLL